MANLADMIEIPATCFQYICCLKFRFSSNVSPKFNIEVDGMIILLMKCVGEKPSSFLRCVEVSMMRNSALSPLCGATGIWYLV